MASVNATKTNSTCEKLSPMSMSIYNQSGLGDLLELPDYNTSKDIITKVLIINKYKMG